MEPRDSHLRLVRPPGIASDTGFQALLAPDLETEPLNGVEMDPGLYVPGIMEWEHHEPPVTFAYFPPDLASEGLTPIESAPGTELPGLQPPTAGEAWNAGKHLATSRRFIAHWLLAMLSGLLLMSWTSLLLSLAAFEDVQALMTIVFAPLVGLVGAATGFYFGEKSSEDRRP
jgi:hypothetical protein